MTFQCDEGYFPTNKTTVTCTNGNWTPLPQCNHTDNITTTPNTSMIVMATLLCQTCTIKKKVFTADHFIPIHTLFLFLVCVLGQFNVQYTLSFLQCMVYQYHSYVGELLFKEEIKATTESFSLYNECSYDTQMWFYFMIIVSQRIVCL